MAIAARRGELLEATADGAYAEVFPVGDERVLSEKMICLLTDNNRRAALARSAETFAGENFSIDSHMRELTRLYGRLIGS